MIASQACIDLIKYFEGFSAEPYRDPCGLWTVGYGHRTYGRQVSMTEAEAELQITFDLQGIESDVSQAVKAPLTQGQFDALCDFCYNLGFAAFQGSTLYEKLNSGDYEGAAAEFGRWIHAGGRILPGLMKRREAERRVFLGTL
jgi:lysozyme